jgi:hypothetical protein
MFNRKVLGIVIEKKVLLCDDNVLVWLKTTYSLPLPLLGKGGCFERGSGPSQIPLSILIPITAGGLIRG